MDQALFLIPIYFLPLVLPTPMDLLLLNILTPPRNISHLFFFHFCFPFIYLCDKIILINLCTSLNETRTPVALITPVETQLGVKPSPVMAGFSSRGPNPITDAMLKVGF